VLREAVGEGWVTKYCKGPDSVDAGMDLLVGFTVVLVNGLSAQVLERANPPFEAAGPAAARRGTGGCCRVPRVRNARPNSPATRSSLLTQFRDGRILCTVYTVHTYLGMARPMNHDHDDGSAASPQTVRSIRSTSQKGITFPSASPKRPSERGGVSSVVKFFKGVALALPFTSLTIGG
jgi:hypothetical protein